ncbi:hypothetical protein HK101_010157 [Irineochytrium annulatum]|nr:hypothetical protein HK101_010157 [Irineochytrium annulatum]
MFSKAKTVITVLFFQPLAFLFVYTFYKVTTVEPGFPIPGVAAPPPGFITDPTPGGGLPQSPSGELGLDVYGDRAGLLDRRPANDSGLLTGGNGNEMVDLEAGGSVGGWVSVETKRNGTRRWCKKCGFWKPDRSHHCSSCGKCVLKMDHHCPWINQYLFVVYAFLYCLYIFLNLLRQLLLAIKNEGDNAYMYMVDVNWIMLFILSAVFALCLLMFTAMHTGLLLANRTTIESMEGGRRVRTASGDVKYHPVVNYYDLGTWRENWIEVFGVDARTWFLPVNAK